MWWVTVIPHEVHLTVQTGVLRSKVLTLSDGLAQVVCRHGQLALSLLAGATLGLQRLDVLRG